MSVKNVKIRFNLEKENDRRVYEYLRSAEKSYSRAVISAICGYMELSETKAVEDAFLERVIATIREEIAKKQSAWRLTTVCADTVCTNTRRKRK